MSSRKQSIISPKDFNLILRVFKSNWWIPLIVVPIFYFSGIFYTYTLTSVYKVSTQVLLQNNDSYYENNVVTDATFYGAQSYVDNSNEKRVLLSYDLLNRVVGKLRDKLEISYFIVGKVRTTEQFGGTPFDVQINSINPELYEQTIDFQILSDKEFQFTYSKGNEKVTKRGEFDKPLIDTVDFDFNLTVNRSGTFKNVRLNTVKEIYYQFVVHSTDFLISRIISDISVENPEYTNILEVSLNDIIPDRAILILDSLNQEYLYSKLKSKYDLNEKTIEFIDKQLDEISVLLKASVDTLQVYKQKKSIINLGWEENDFLTKIGIYDNARSEAQLQVKALNDLEKYIIEDKDPQFLPPTVYITEKDGFMSKAVSDLYNKQIELNRLYNLATEVNPVIQDYISSIKKIKQDLLIYINNLRSATKLKIDNINSEIGRYVAEAKAIPPKQQDLLGIQRTLNVNEGIYNFLLEKKANTRIAKASIVAEAKVIEMPRNTGTVSPDRAAIKRMFITIGFSLSIGIILVRTIFSRIRTIEHLKELTEIPSLGVIPYIKNPVVGEVIVEDQPNSRSAESFRNIRTNLQYANAGQNAKTFLITSFSPAEGKTFTSVNLAATLAKSGKRTIIVELDLHKPKVFKSLGYTAVEKGITTFISGLNPIEETIVQTKIQNLWCMFAGPIPPNPSDFVLSEKLKEALNYAKNNFDYVIIDSPPAGLLSDSVYLIQFVDATLFVLNANSSTKRTVSFVQDLIETNKIQNLFFILNGVRKISKRYYYKGYGYSYGYGYGYGYGKGYGYRK